MKIYLEVIRDKDGRFVTLKQVTTGKLYPAAPNPYKFAWVKIQDGAPTDGFSADDIVVIDVPVVISQHTHEAT